MKKIYNVFIIFLCFFVFSVAAGEKTNVKLVRENFIFRYPIIKINRIYDGDTFWADIDMGFNIVMSNEKIRVVGCDAYELNDDKGPEAKLFTEIFLSTGTLTLVTQGNRDSFGRILATVEKNGKYLDDSLTEANLVTGRFRDTDIIK